MIIQTQKIVFKTTNQIEFVDVTERIEDILGASGIREGMVTVYSSHTTMGVGINHNEPLLLQDFMLMLYRVAPVDNQYNHDLFELKKESKSDGRSNGHSHCKSLIVGNSESIPVQKGRMMLGERQSIFAIEFDGARSRDVMIQIMGE